MMRTAIAILGVFVCAAPVAAQVCLGGPSFAASPVHVGLVFAGDDTTSTIGGEVAFGGAGGEFGGFSIAGQTIDGLNGTGVALGAFGGQDYALGATRRTAVCPIASVAYQSGPDLDPIQITGIDFGGGFNVGYVGFDNARGLRIIPTGGASIRRGRVTASLDDLSESVSDMYGLVAIGVGIVFPHAFLIPTIVVPVSLGDSDPIFQFRAGFSF